MTGPVPQLPNVPLSNLPLDISRGAGAFISGLLQAQRQKQQDALTAAMQQSLMGMREATQRHYMTEENLRQDEIQRQIQKDRETALMNMYPDVAGPFGTLDNVIAQQEFSPEYSKAAQAARTSHAPVPFQFRGQTFTYTPKEFNPQGSLNLGEREDQFNIKLTQDWYKMPENKLIGQYGANYVRALATLKQARDSGNPTTFKSALLQFVNMADPTGRQSLGLIKVMTDIDPSLLGRWNIFREKLMSGTLPQEEVQNMLEHLNAVVKAVAQDYDMRREAWINSYPGRNQEAIRTSDQLFPMMEQFLPENQAGGAPSPNSSLDALGAKHGIGRP